MTTHTLKGRLVGYRANVARVDQRLVTLPLTRDLSDITRAAVAALVWQGVAGRWTDDVKFTDQDITQAKAFLMKDLAA